ISTTGAMSVNQMGDDVRAASGNITLSVNDLTITGQSVNAGMGIVTLQQAGTTARPIDLGTNSAGSLGLTDAELDPITAGTLRIGDNNGGALRVGGAVTRRAATNGALAWGGDITPSGGQTDPAGGPLLLQPGDSPASLRPTRAGSDAAASTVSLDGLLTI